MIEQRTENPPNATELAPSNGAQTEKENACLLDSGEAQEFRSEWGRVQTGFVDEPRKSVQEADALVDRAIKRLSEIFAAERARLEHEWDRGQDVSTEDLRVALRRYRSFFDRLLSI